MPCVDNQIVEAANTIGFWFAAAVFLYIILR